MPRIVRVDAGRLGRSATSRKLGIVQDASVVAGSEGRSPAKLLIEELDDALTASSSEAYLCCVNRGILDDSLIYAIESNQVQSRQLLEAITRAVSLAPDAPSCWPLEGFASIAVWPMDAESLLVKTDDAGPPPASLLLDQVIAEERWLAPGTCPAGIKCPFCNSRATLARSGPREALLQILRWYELGSGKRWSFRDLFSLVSYLLAGHRLPEQEHHSEPCHWAARLMELDAQAVEGARPTKQKSSAIFLLATASYEHALFHRWEKGIASSLLKDVKDLALEQDHTLMGLYYFIQGRKSPYLPATIAALLEGVVDLLDPAMANPDIEIPVSARSNVVLRELDARFSRSIEEGIEFVRKYQFLSVVELDLLRRIAKVDTGLTASPTRRKKPAAASRVQQTLRDYACRLVRRSLGARSAVVLDADILEAFQKVVQDDDDSGDLLYEVARGVEELLNKGEYFEVSLTTTFGQPLPPPNRQATLIVPRRGVRMREAKPIGRPSSPLCFLQVGSGHSEQPIALTYDLFKAIKELERGMSVASLPRSVVALLDTTKARLSGPIVRDEEVLLRAKIRMGTSGIAIAKHRGAFVSRKEGTKI